MKYTHINRVEELQDWINPKSSLIDVIEGEDRIELIYIENGFISSERKVYKIIYSVVEGQWNRSEPIWGKIIPSREETYEF